MIHYSNYHSMIMASLDRSLSTHDDYVYESLCNSEEGKECAFHLLTFGYEFITAYMWIKMKNTANSADMRSLFRADAEHSLGTLSAMLKKRFEQDLLIDDAVDHPVILGGNVIVPSTVKVTSKHLVRAYNMYRKPKEDPLIKFLNSMCKRTGGQAGSINSIVYTSPSDFKKNGKRSNLAVLINLIDFPIPSVVTLLCALGYNYFPCNPYLDADNVHGKCQSLIGGLATDFTSDTGEIRLYYTDPAAKEPFTKFKFIPCDLLVPMILDNSAFRPMEYLDAQDKGIITNDLV